MTDPLERYVERVPFSTCHYWVGGLTTAGYGMAWVDGKLVYAHRLSYERKHGEYNGVVRHRCDNPSCVNHDHLESGTQAENIGDMMRRNRRQYRLTLDGAAEVRRLLGQGISQRAIAKQMGIAQATVSLVKRGKTWTRWNM